MPNETAKAFATESSTPSDPKVLISYSHDSDEHKDWVRELATRLRASGIDILLDQWELGLGDDVPKFMERSVTDSVRVLMVCTEEYNRKANDGKGGVGYEATIVTGELVADVGTRKFIPITRQSSDKKILPTCLNTRFFVDFSDDEEYEDKLEELIRELHDAPAFVKPPLGQNPFAFNSDLKSTSKALDPEVKEETSNDSLTATYAAALALAKDNNFAEWTKFVHHHKNLAQQSLHDWRNQNETCTPPLAKELPAFFCPAVELYNHVFAIVLAAIDSGNKQFKNQLALIDWIRQPKGWNRNGVTLWVDLPDLVLMTFQALLGSFTIARQQPQLTYNLATTPISDRYNSREKTALFLNTNLTGWAESMNHHFTLSETFLKNYFSNQDWLHSLFGGEDELLSALGAYYSFLNIIDFFSASKHGLIEDSRGKDFNISQIPRTPQLSANLPADIQHLIHTLLNSNAEFFAEVAENNGLSQNQISTDWAVWLKHSYSWVSNVYGMSLRGYSIPHHDFPSIMSQSSNDLNTL